MRVSLWIGLPLFLLGIGFSYLADGIIQTQAATQLQSFAQIFAAVLFVLFSAVLLGTGSALVIHWIFGFGNHWLAWMAEIVFSFALLFTGIGASAVQQNIWTALQIIFTFASSSALLFFLSFVTLFGGFTQGISTILRFFKKRRNEQRTPAPRAIRRKK